MMDSEIYKIIQSYLYGNVDAELEKLEDLVSQNPKALRTIIDVASAATKNIEKMRVYTSDDVLSLLKRK